MRVSCRLREIAEDLGLSKGELAHELGVEIRTIENLYTDNGKKNWRLDRDALYRYLLFAHLHEVEAFRIAPHPIWKTFTNDPDIHIFRGSNRADGPVEVYLNRYFERLHSATRTYTEADRLEEAMTQHNCLVIGSPKSNRASEIALALLWGARPFDASPENRDRLPIHFLGMGGLDHPEPSALLVESTRHGFDVRIPQSQQRRFLKVDWLPPEKYGPSTREGQEGAVLVVCHRPLGTEKDVTTVVLAGYTGTSTHEVAHQATYERIPDLEPAATPGQPCFAVLKFDFAKKAQRRKSSLDLRTPKRDTAQWSPPWESFFRT